MPQVDLSSVCGDPKVACETTAGTDEIDPSAPATEIQHIDYAPASFCLSKDAELDWLSQNAYIERKDSNKGSNPNPNPNPNQVSVSQRHSINVKLKKKTTSIIGLPMKQQKPSYAASDVTKNRRSSVRLFPKRSGPASGVRPAVAVSEPSSPKVSCMGRVKSKKDRKKNRQKKTEPNLTRTRSVKERKTKVKTGFWNNFRSMFLSKGCNKPDGEVHEPEAKPGSSKEKKRGYNFGCENNNDDDNSVGPGRVEPPGLGGVKRFASGRRSDGWAGDIVVDDVAKSEQLGRGPIWRRREVGPPESVDVNRDWKSVGPASV